MHWSTLPASVLLLGASLSAATPLSCNGAHSRDLKACNEKLALNVIKSLKATKFCSDYLHVSTVTVRRTTTTTVPVKVTVSSTTAVGYSVTTGTTDSVAATETLEVDGPSVTVTSTETNYIPVVVTDSYVTTTTNTVTAATQYAKDMRKRDAVASAVGAAGRERERQLEALGLSERDLSPRYYAVAIPGPLKPFAAVAISKACSCIVTKAHTTTVTTKVTARSTSTVSLVYTTSTPAATVTVSATVTYTVTETTTQPPTTDTVAVTDYVRSTITTTDTSTSVVQATSTAIGQGTYIRQFSGSNCVQNIYNHYDLVDEPYSTPDRLFQVCAARCASYGSACKSFFAYQDNDYPYQWCIIDDEPYDPAYRQCNIPFSGVNLAYNSPY